MPITTTLGTLVEAEPALTRLTAVQLPVKTAYAVARLIRAIEPELQEFHRQRMALLKQHGTERPARTDDERQKFGDKVTEVVNAHRAPFLAAMGELLAIAVTLDRPPLPMADIATISAADLLALGPLVEEPHDDAPTSR